MANIIHKRKLRRLRRVRSSLCGLATKPRISVFRSNRYIYAQAIDDEKRKTIAHFSSFDLKKVKNKKKMAKEKESLLVGQGLAKILKQKKISAAIFDRGSYLYMGRIKAPCEGMRQGGVKI